MDIVEKHKPMCQGLGSTGCGLTVISEGGIVTGLQEAGVACRRLERLGEHCNYDYNPRALTEQLRQELRRDGIIQ